jgi:hypothetical protein
MKSSIIKYSIIFVIGITIISCKRLSVPTPDICPQIALNSAVGTDSQTVFVNAPIVPINYAVTFDAADDTTGFFVEGNLPPGVTGAFSGNTFIITGTPTTSVGSPFGYTVTTIGSTCRSVTTISGSIIVDTCAQINVSSAIGTDAQTVAVNDPITNITYTVSAATGATVSGLPSGVTGNFAAGVFTISGTPTTTVGSPFTYTIAPSIGSCTAPTTGTITVTP